MNININEDLLSFIIDQAKKDDVTDIIWVERKVNAYIKTLAKDSVINIINQSSSLDTSSYVSAISEVKSKIDAVYEEKNKKEESKITKKEENETAEKNKEEIENIKKLSK